MISHRQIMANVAAAVYDSADVRDYCISNFGRGLAVHVGAYAQGIPGENDSPFLWLTPREENEEVAVDSTFTVRMIVGGMVKGENGEKVITNTLHERTATENGLTINGGNKVVEDLRDMIIGVVRGAAAGAIVQRIRREENDISHFPLEWAEIYVEYMEPEAL